MMRTFRFSLPLFLLVTAVFLSAGCYGAVQTGRLAEPLPHSTKGYELYSWQTTGDGWQYTLITGTNRQKTVEELTAGDDALTADGWVKLTVSGSDALLASLDRLPAGEQIVWHGATAAPAGEGNVHFRLPEKSVVAAVDARCQQLGLKLIVVAGPLEAVLAAPKTVVAGATVPLTFTLINHASDPLYVLKWYTPLEGVAGKIFRVAHGDRVLPYEGILAMRGDPDPESYVYLQPRDAVTATVDLAQAYDFSEVGTYTITFLSPRISDMARTKAEMARTVDELGPVTIVSNPVTVNVSSGE